METWRLWAVIIIMVLFTVDMAATYYYVYTYKQWQPDKPYNLIELNPLLVFLWNTFGLHLGMFIGVVVIGALNYYVARYAWPIVVFILGSVLLITLYNHYSNITLLGKLILQYPTGHLPESVFGVVEGNNRITE